MNEFYEPRRAKSKPKFNLNINLNPNNKPITGLVCLAFTGVLSVVMIVFILSGKKSESNVLPKVYEPGVLSANASVSASDTISASDFAGYPENEAWKLTLVNRWNPVEDGYGDTLTYVQLRGDLKIDQRAYPDLQAMMDACRAENLYPVICSAYRSIDDQRRRYNEKFAEYRKQGYSEDDAKKLTEEWVAYPGTSEHHLGLAVDIASEKYQFFDEGQEKTLEQQWLIKNCWKYGFILRYPTEKKEITGINYEPWHYRYVGKEAAEYLTKNNLTLEEYLGKVNDSAGN